MANFKEEVTFAGLLLRWGLLLMVVVLVLGGIANIFGFASFAFWAPKVEQVRYNTFKESQAYNDGMLRDLQNLKMEYLRGNPDQQAALRAIVIQRFSVYDTNRLPADLQAFYLNIQGQP